MTQQEPTVHRQCQLAGCDAPHFCKGWCRRHYEQVRRGKEPRLTTSEYTEESAVCVAPDCGVVFRQRSAGSTRLYCSRLCRDKTDKAARRAAGTYLPAHKKPGQERCSVEGCENARYVRGFCIMHLARVDKYGVPGEAARRKAPKGEGDWYTSSDGYIRRFVNGELQLQHREVVAAHIGRPLWPDETVHHRNGQRADNRIENLELWSSWQPSGQRVDEKVAWAREILARYT